MAARRQHVQSTAATGRENGGSMYQEELSDYLARKAERLAREETISAWHLKAHVDGGVALPYDHSETWLNVNVYDTEDGSWELNPEKSIEALAKIVQYASKLEGVTIEKRYDSSEFELVIDTPEGITFRYHANREAVCTKRVVGVEHVPEKIIPAKEKEIIEWDCDPVSLLAHKREVES